MEEESVECKLLCPSCGGDHFTHKHKNLVEVKDDDFVTCLKCLSLWKVDFLCIVPIEE